MSEVFVEGFGVSVSKKSERLVVKRKGKVIFERPFFDVERVIVATEGAIIYSAAVRPGAGRGELRARRGALQTVCGELVSGVRVPDLRHPRRPHPAQGLRAVQGLRPGAHPVLRLRRGPGPQPARGADAAPHKDPREEAGQHPPNRDTLSGARKAKYALP